jgi:DNA-binding PadR family transcriptional regulator
MTDHKPKSLLPLTPATFHILLSLHDGVKHGYRIKREVEERTGGVVRLGAGTLYEAIQRLDRSGLIDQTKAPAELETENARWKFYRITAFGRKTLTAELRRLESDVEFAHELGLAAGPQDAR